MSQVSIDGQIGPHEIDIGYHDDEDQERQTRIRKQVRVWYFLRLIFSLLMLFVYSTRLRLVLWMTRDNRKFLQENLVELNDFEETFTIMFKLCQLYIVLNLSEYTMTLIYFVTVSFFYRKFHDDQGFCYIRKAYMMVIWMFNLSV